MARTIKKLESEKEFKDFAEIVSLAYPGFKLDTEEKKKKMVEGSMKTQEKNPFTNFYGIFEDKNILGGMRYHDYQMKFLSEIIDVGGIGLIAVDFLHKKEKIAKDIVFDFINHYFEKRCPLVMLYPFKPGFYKKMGFGFGPNMYQYKVKPKDLPKGTSKANISFVDDSDAEKMLECYNRLFEKTNGFTKKYIQEFEMILKNPNVKYAAYKTEDKIEGYIAFEFKTNDSKTFVNDIVIHQIVYENDKALSQLMTFLNSQQDQIRHIIINTFDDNFRFLLDNPTNCVDNMFVLVYHESFIGGTGLMYRVIDVELLFDLLKKHDFNNQNCCLKINIIDNLLERNNKSFYLNLKNGFIIDSNNNNYDVEIEMDISEFSSLITCSVDFKSLYNLGKAKLSDVNYLNKVNSIFSSSEKPKCLTIF